MHRGALPIQAALAIASVVSNALAYTHSIEYEIDGAAAVGCLHRDLKPGNILLSHRGDVRLTDFGIAKPVNVSRHTPDGNIVGSLQYISPEQLRDEKIDCRADIFSFGCVLYEMLTGHKAFATRALAELIPMRLENRFDPVERYDCPIPSSIRNLIDDCMQRDVEKRPKNMHSVAEKINKALRAHSSRSHLDILSEFMDERNKTPRFITLKPEKRPLPYMPIGLAAVIAVLLGLVTFYSGIGRQITTLYESSVFGAADLAVSTTEREKNSMPENPPVSIPQQEKRVKRGTVSRSRLATAANTSFPDSLRRLYRSDNLLTVMIKESQRGNYPTVLTLSNYLPTHQRRSRTGVILLMRALDKQRQLTLDFFETYKVEDAEYYLRKADYLYRNQRYNRSLQALGHVFSTSSLMGGQESIYMQAHVFKARILTAQFFQLPDSDVQKAALNIWHDILDMYRNEKNHLYYREARREIARLEKM
jgi:serine/threonine protein kinase